MTCRVRDLPVLEITVRHLPQFIACGPIHLVAPDQDCQRIRKSLGTKITLWSETEFMPGMTIETLKRLNVPGFPRAAGWYFQQLLKLQFAFVQPEEDFYLIWDADTVPLRPMHFFDDAGKMLLTKAREHHQPYFDTYKTLFGASPLSDFSLVAQHMVIQKSVAREMLKQIEQRVSGTENWAWKIMRSLPSSGDNLLSEYETYGHYLESHYPDRVRFIERAWLRENTVDSGRGVPDEKELRQLAERYEYAAFERANRGWRRFAKFLHGTARNLFRKNCSS